MIWDMKTVHAIRGYYAETGVDESAIHRAPYMEVEQRVTGALFEHIAALIAKAWPVKVHLADFKVEKIPDPVIPITTYRMHWQPEGRDGEIMGGPHDGIPVPPPSWDDILGRHQIRLADKPETPPQLMAITVSDPVTGEHPVVTKSNHISAYEISGWSDMHRRWIYTPQD